ncbi:MAG TPA: SPW repeat protein [Candidatus Obscuribacterales bacterium]
MSIRSHEWWMSEHRGWEDFASAGAGVLLLFSPLAIGSFDNPAVAINSGIFGVLIAAIALIERDALQRWEELLEGLCGVWVIASPFIFSYGGVLMAIHLVLGVAVLALALLELWQDKNRKMG